MVRTVDARAPLDQSANAPPDTSGRLQSRGRRQFIWKHCVEGSLSSDATCVGVRPSHELSVPPSDAVGGRAHHRAAQR